MQPRKEYDALAVLRKQVRELIDKKYQSVEKFCYEESFQKSTLSRLLSGKRAEFQISTLKRIAEALGKKVVVRLD